MGFFSYKTQDTNETIWNTYSDKETFTVFLVEPNGNRYEEVNYEGYGVFGGVDIYELVARLNGCEGRNTGILLTASQWWFDVNAQRHHTNEEIERAKELRKSLVLPNLVRDPIGWKHVNEMPEHCSTQGFFGVE
jgi:hypothetical protein